jgi:hypothetical protein
MGQANTLTNLGRLYHRQGAVEWAAEVLNQADELFVRVGDRDGEAENCMPTPSWQCRNTTLSAS